MAEALLNWARTIICYMIFLSLAGNLLAGSSYGKYLRLFGGMVLILIVLSPAAAPLDLEEQMGYLFDQIAFKQEAEGLKKEIFGMEEKRLKGITAQYRENVEEEVEQLAEDQGYECREVSVILDENRESQDYGKLLGINIVLTGREGEKNQRDASFPASGDDCGDRPVSIDPIGVEPVRIEMAAPVSPSVSQAEGENGPKDLKGKVEQYYGLEGEAVKVKWKDD